MPNSASTITSASGNPSIKASLRPPTVWNSSAIRFASGVLGRAVGLVFDSIANSMIDSFAQRADALYGSAKAAE